MESTTLQSSLVSAQREEELNTRHDPTMKRTYRALNAQLVGDGHEHFEDGHEGGDLAEVAAADHLGVDLQAPLVVLAGHAAADLVESAEDVLRELRTRSPVRFLHQLLVKKACKTIKRWVVPTVCSLSLSYRYPKRLAASSSFLLVC